MAEKERVEPTSGIVLFLGSDIIGRGENIELGNLLMQKFLHEVAWNEIKPEFIIAMNNGVKLVTSESPVSEELKQLEKQGVNILACGTCLSRLELTELVSVGQVSNMKDITDIMLNADKIISM